ncbi:MAG: DUF4328 domain-containing protein [Acidimicrobiia bacterium]|nr:DUF4328 domain-containing protein [Acidimicrobiia bacterium]
MEPEVPPGWYPDPWYPGSVRYWDGTIWTTHAQAPGPTLRVDLAKVRTWPARVSIAFWVQAVVSAIGAVVSPLVLDGGRSTNDRFSFALAFGTGGNVRLELLGLVGFGALVVVVVWAHHITQTARALGLRTTLNPGWAAVGWLLPIVSLWFPYMAVRDALPPGHPGRGLAGSWWTLQIAVVIIGAVATFVSPGVGAAIGCLGAVCALGAGYLGHRLATAIGEEHERLASGGAPQ